MTAQVRGCGGLLVATVQPKPLTAEITFTEHPNGTGYRAVVRHGDPESRDRHEALGFFEDWGSVTDALAALAESRA